jgi:hypothetical protein
MLCNSILLTTERINKIAAEKKGVYDNAEKQKRMIKQSAPGFAAICIQ